MMAKVAETLEPAQTDDLALPEYEQLRLSLGRAIRDSMNAPEDVAGDRMARVFEIIDRRVAIQLEAMGIDPEQYQNR